MYGEKILISAADGMEQLISLFLLKIANQFYSYLENVANIICVLLKTYNDDITGINFSPLSTVFILYI